MNDYCDKCIYLGQFGMCLYWEIADELRGCPGGKGCKRKKTSGERRKPMAIVVSKRSTRQYKLKKTIELAPKPEPPKERKDYLERHREKTQVGEYWDDIHLNNAKKMECWLAGMTDAEIAEECNRSESAIKQWRLKMRLPKNRRKNDA